MASEATAVHYAQGDTTITDLDAAAMEWWAWYRLTGGDAPWISDACADQLRAQAAQEAEDRSASEPLDQTLAAIARCTRTALPGKISLDNGRSVRPVAELSDADVAKAMALAEGMDDDAREAVHRAIASHDPREFLDLYCRLHFERFAAPWTIG